MIQESSVWKESHSPTFRFCIKPNNYPAQGREVAPTEGRSIPLPPSLTTVVPSQTLSVKKTGQCTDKAACKNLASFLSKYLLQPILENGRGDYGFNSSYKVVELLTTSTREGLKRQPGQVAAQPEASNTKRKSRGGSTGKEEEFPDGGIYMQR